MRDDGGSFAITMVALVAMIVPLVRARLRLLDLLEGQEAGRRRGRSGRTHGGTHPRPDQAGRDAASACGPDPRALRGARARRPGGEARPRRRGARRRALRRAPREAVLRRARRVHHLVADAGPRARGGVGDRRSSARRWARRTRSTPRPGRSAATSRSRCRTTSSTARIRRRRRSARSRSGSPTASLSDLPEHVRRNRDEWTSWAPEYADEAPRAWAAEEIIWGVWRRSGDGGARAAGDGRGARRRRARVRHGVRLGLARAPGRAAGRGRRHARPARDGAADAGALRARVPPAGGQRRGRAPSGRELRPRRLGVRGVHSGRSVRWVSEAARLLRPGGELVFLVDGLLCDPLRARRRSAARTRAAQALRSACTASSGRTRPRSSSTSATATGSGSCAARGSRSSTSSSCRRPEAGPEHRYAAVPTRWARQWPSEEIWRARKR